MLNLNVLNEFSTLKAVVLGVAKSNGPTPTPEACYDPSSLKHVLQGTYPSEKDMVEEMSALVQISNRMASRCTAQILLKIVIKFSLEI